jgi:hypothetical protein
MAQAVLAPLIKVMQVATEIHHLKTAAVAVAVEQLVLQPLLVELETAAMVSLYQSQALQ